MPRGRPIVVTLRPAEARALLRAAKTGIVVLPPVEISRCSSALQKLRRQLEIVKGEDHGG
jgi:hypothetical protein